MELERADASENEDGESSQFQGLSLPCVPASSFLMWQMVHQVEQPVGTLFSVQPHRLGRLVTHPVREVVNLHRMWDCLPWPRWALPTVKLLACLGWPCWTGIGKEFGGLERGQDFI